MAALEEINLMIDEASTFTASLSNDGLNTPKIHARLIRTRANETGVLREFDRNLEVLYRDRWLVYTGKATPEELRNEKFASLKILKTDLDVFLSADEQIQNLARRIEVQKQKISLLDEAIRMCNQRPYLLKTILDARKFEAGLN